MGYVSSDGAQLLSFQLLVSAADTEKQVKVLKEQLRLGQRDLKEEQGLPDRPSSELSPPHTTHFLSLSVSTKHDSSNADSDMQLTHTHTRAAQIHGNRETHIHADHLLLLAYCQSKAIQEMSTRVRYEVDSDSPHISLSVSMVCV